MRFLIVFLLCLQVGFAAIVPDGRLATNAWVNSGVVGGIPTRTNIYAMLTTAASAATIQAAIDSCPSNSVVFLTNGTYTFATTFVMDRHPGVTLRGNGPTNTILAFSDANSDCYISIRQPYPGNTMPFNNNWTGGYARGTTTINITSTNNMKVGDIVILNQLADNPNSVTGQGGEGLCGSCDFDGGLRVQQQVVQITALLSSSSISIDPPIVATNWSSGLSPHISWSSDQQPSEMIGLEDFSITTTNDPTPPDSLIRVRSVRNWWVKNVKLIKTKNFGVRISYALNGEIRHCWFNDNLTHASQCYSVAGFQGDLMRVEDNIFFPYTSGVISGGGTMGWVVAYNFFTNSMFEGVSATAIASSVAFHAGNANYHLTEGNWGGKYDADDIHGSATWNTSLRNRWIGWQTNKTAETFPVQLNGSNLYFNAVGNILGRPGYHDVYEHDGVGDTGSHPVFDLNFWDNSSTSTPDHYDPTVQSTMIRKGNWNTVNGAIPAGEAAGEAIPSSYYLTSKPSYFGGLSWPPFDPLNPGTATNNLSYTNIPAGYRFAFGVDPPAGGTSPPLITSITNDTTTNFQAYTYQITSDQTITSWGAIGLPNGLTVNTGNGFISGTLNIANSTVTTNITLGATNANGGSTTNFALTIVALAAPIVNSATTYGGTVGVVLDPYQITATQYPTSYGATGLPAGLSVSTSTGLITGTPTTNGVFSVTIGATNQIGGDTDTLTLTIGTSAPTISVAPSSWFYGEIAELYQTSSRDFTVTNAGSAGSTLTGNVSITTAAPFSIVGSTNFSLVGGAGTNITVLFSPTSKGTNTANIIFTSNGGGATNGLTGVAFPMATNLTVKMTNALISPPFTADPGDFISQGVTTADVIELGGRAVYGFYAINAGIYTFSGIVNAAGTGNDSMFFNLDANPIAPDMEWSWNGPLSFASKIVTIDSDGPPFPITFAHQFTLSAGVHKIVLVGRENDAQLRSITIIPSTTPITVTNLQIQRVSMAGRISAQ